MTRYKEESNAQEKIKLLKGLASTRREDLLCELMQVHAKDEATVRSQDFFTLLAFISSE